MLGQDYEKVAVVTGAAQGIGLATAHAFADAGWSLVLADRDGTQLKVATGEMVNVELVIGDLRDEAVSSEALRVAQERFGRVDAVVGNAGVTQVKPIHEVTDSDFDEVFDVNVRALVWLAKAARPYLKRFSGNLVIVSSKVALAAQRETPLYVASKGAALQLGRALALDWADDGVRVNVVCPGIVDTPMLAEYLASLPEPMAAALEHVHAQPLGRLATPEECAEAIVFLASPAASFITGVALPVDGGFTAQ